MSKKTISRFCPFKGDGNEIFYPPLDFSRINHIIGFAGFSNMTSNLRSCARFFVADYGVDGPLIVHGMKLQLTTISFIA
jgi:hypothetical protein